MSYQILFIASARDACEQRIQALTKRRLIDMAQKIESALEKFLKDVVRNNRVNNPF